MKWLEWTNEMGEPPEPMSFFDWVGAIVEGVFLAVGGYAIAEACLSWLTG